MNPQYAKIFDPADMQTRRREFFRFVRSRARDCFNADGTYKPNMDPDRRATFWIFPALIDTEDPAEREFALRLLDKDPCWGGWNIFTTSSIASILVRERSRLTPELVRRAEENLDRFVDAGAERRGSSGANDYMFHGYNDNMPAMATRALIFAGDVLGRKDLTDHGLFFLEGLCAHFQRRGLLGEYSSSTYTPITLTALMDVAECSRNAEAREMALACARRVLLDVLVHWHPTTGAGSGSSSRAYVPDAMVAFTSMATLMWYLAGDPLAPSPIAVLGNPPYDGPIGHGPDAGFALAGTCEFFTPDYKGIGDDIVEFARRPRTYPHSVRATTDAGRTANIQTRTWQQRLWTLGTASCEMWAGNHHHVTLRGTLARTPQPKTWKDRVAFWHYFQSGDTDIGDTVPAGYNDGTTEVAGFTDAGEYHTLQQKGSAMVLGHLGTGLLDKDVSRLSFTILFTLFGGPPDEMAEGDAALAAWDGVSAADRWQFLRFGDVYVGIRMAGMRNEQMLPVRRSIKGRYLRIEIPVVDATTGPVRIDRAFRQWLDLGYVVEMADKDECGSFAEFRRQCLRTTWEYVHWFYRNSRYCGRHGELQIVDSIDPRGLRFMAIDGKIEEPVLFEASGVDPKLLRLYPDGRFIRQRRIYWRRDFIGSPFYETFKQHRLATDLPGAEAGG